MTKSVSDDALPEEGPAEARGLLTSSLPLIFDTHPAWIRDDLLASLNSSQAEIPTATVKEKWSTFKSIRYKVLKEELGTAMRKHED